jgi:hypothetical protein
MWGYGLNPADSEYGHVAGTCECGRKPSGYIKCRERSARLLASPGGAGLRGSATDSGSCAAVPEAPLSPCTVLPSAAHAVGWHPRSAHARGMLRSAAILTRICFSSSFLACGRSQSPGQT